MKEVSLFFLLFSSGAAHLQLLSDDPNYLFYWGDEFNGTTIDPVKWLVHDWRDWEAEDNYSPPAQPSVTLWENAEENFGTLKLHFKRETITCGTDFNHEWGYVENNVGEYYCSFQEEYGVPYYFSGASMNNTFPFQHRYGYYEARMKVPYKYGSWSAFWTFRVFEGEDNAGEIDFYEILGRFEDQNLVTTNIHLDYCSSGDEPGATCPNYPNGTEECEGITCYGQHIYTDDHTAWHTYGVEITPDKITWFIDGITERVSVNPGINMILRLILGIGSDPNYYAGIDPSPFDVILETDYIRFYKLQHDCNTALDDVCSITPLLFNNKVKQRIEIDCGTAVTVPAGSHYWRAQEYVLIDSEFTVPIGSELFIDVNDCY